MEGHLWGDLLSWAAWKQSIFLPLILSARTGQTASLSTKKLGNELAEQLIPVTGQLYTKKGEAQVVMESIYKTELKLHILQSIS